jgi:DNA-binding beta-propeller fold protein YncE
MRDWFRRNRRRFLILLLLLILIGIGGLGVYYWKFRSVPGLPGIVADLGIAAPHFLFAIDGIDQPSSVAVSPDGDRIFVTESDGMRLTHIFDYSGEHIKSFAPPDSTPLSRIPGGVAINGDGQVYVIDILQHNIGIYSLDGEFLEYFVPDGDPGFEWAPVALTFDQEGNLYVTDDRHPRHQILVFDPDGRLKAQFGYFGKGEGMFAFPTDVAIDGGGNILVADSANNRLQVFDSEGDLMYTIPGDFALPSGLGFDRGGRLHVLDSLAHQVVVLNVEDGIELLYTYGSIGLERGQFYFPSDLALDGAGRIYIADHFGYRVQVWSF